MARPEPEWQTARLVARPAGVADTPVLFEHYARDPAVARYMTWTPHRKPEETLEFLRRCESAWLVGSAFPWTLWAKEDGSLVGLLEIRVHGGSVDLGYALVQRCWGKGLMTEALRSIVSWALAQSDVFRVWATCDVENLASARVLERAGMTREGMLRRWIVHPNLSNEPRDSFCYAIVKSTPLDSRGETDASHKVVGEIVGLDHVQLAMPAGQEARARDFYAGVLGLIEESKPEHLAKRGGVWFRNGSLRLHLGVDGDFHPARKAHPALLVNGLTTLADRLLAAGYPSVPDEPLEGFKRVYVSDPFGNRIELLEPR